METVNRELPALWGCVLFEVAGRIDDAVHAAAAGEERQDADLAFRAHRDDGVVCPDLISLLLENIAYTLELPGEMTEAAFVRAVIEETGAGLLLDLENVHANASNHGYDPIEYLETLPLERVVEVHLAGGIQREGRYIDSHTRPVPEESWALLEWLAPRTGIRAVIIERDDDLPPFTELLAEVRRAKEILDAAR